MLSLVERVAARHRMAAFIPDKFFKDYEVEFERLIATPLKDRPLYRASWLITEEVIPLFKRFIKELIELAPQAKVSLTDRLEARVTMLEKLATGCDEAGKSTRAPYPATTTLHHVLFHIQVGIDTQLEKLLPILGKAFKLQVSIDANQVEALAQRGLKKATPEERAAIDAVDDWSNQNSRLQYDFYQKHIDKSIPRLIKKERIEANGFSWFQFIHDVLAANYTGEPRYSQFDVYGMKVVIDDASITQDQHDDYVKEIITAYHILKAKKLAHAWYGHIYIECKTCDGRPNVGGHYNIQRDHIKLFSRPFRNTETIIHELGHRYWYKFMTISQREKFEDFVKVRTRPKPSWDYDYKPDIQSPQVVSDALEKVEKVFTKIRATVREFEKTRLRKYRAILDKFETPLFVAARLLTDEVYTAVQNKGGPRSSATAKLEWEQLMAAIDAAHKHLARVRKLEDKLNTYPDGPNDWEAIFKKERGYWIAELEDLLNVVAASARAYVEACIAGYNKSQETLKEDELKRWQAEQDAIVKPVMPVSEYGGTNISEAFAEAFLHYVIGASMNADQRASFKSVLLDKDRTASKVAARWHHLQN